MQTAPFKASGPDNDLGDFILPLVEDAITDHETKVYVFGEMWTRAMANDTDIFDSLRRKVFTTFK